MSIFKSHSTKHILAIICTICMVVTLLPTTVFAANAPTSQWKDVAASSFAGGNGSESSPYLIENEKQLAKLASDVNGGEMYAGKYFRLENNLDLSARRWNPIGTYKWESNGTTTNASFAGIFDGNNKTISGLYVDEREDKNSAGLFGYISSKTTSAVPEIKDLTISDAVIYSAEEGLNQLCSGILAGKAMVNEGLTLKVTNVSVSGNITNEITNGSNFIGGMIGDAYRVTATDCKAENVTISGGTNIGGFVGNASGSIFSKCKASGSISGGWTLGGFVGYSSASTLGDASTGSSFSNCIADVDVNGNDWRLGGFIGFLEFGKVEKSVSYGDVTSTVTGYAPRLGGFVGENSGSIKNSYAAGTVTGAHPTISAGGFMGFDSNGTTTECMYDKTKNPTLSAIGEIGTAGTNNITEGTTKESLTGICTDVFGGHDPSDKWTIDVEPTYTTAGSKSYHCTRCDERTSITEIPMLPTAPTTPTIPATGNTTTTESENKPSVPQTGDNSPMIPVLLLGISSLGAVLILINKRKIKVEKK